MRTFLCARLWSLLAVACSLSAGTQMAQALVYAPFGSVWRYLDNGSDQGTAWRAQSFDDSAWPSGPGVLGFGGDGEQTVLQGGHITHYFRHAFTATALPATSNLLVRLQRDDGAIVYLNGTEVFRSNMPTGAINHLTLASSAVSGADETNMFFSSLITGSLLVNGINVVAVEVHQATANSGDLGFDLELSTRPLQQGSLAVAWPQGFSFIGNPTSPSNNTLNDLFPNLADGTEFRSWNFGAQSYDVSVLDGSSFEWIPNRTFGNGEGALVNSPMPQVTTYATPIQEPPVSATRPSTPGRRLVGCRWPVASTFEEVLGFPPAEGDKLQFFDGMFQSVPTVPTREFIFSNNGWLPNLPPLVQPGQAVFVDLVAIPPPTIVQQPPSQTVNEGDMALFFVGASGTPPIQFQWRKNGLPIPGATLLFFGVTNATPNDAAAYSVVVANPGGSVTSSNAFLTVRPLLTNRLFINEWLASNSTGLRDEDGELSDWIELFNAYDSPLDVGGAYLANSAANPTLWPIPEGTVVPPHGHWLVFASAKNRTRHTNFQLEDSGGVIQLRGRDGTTLVDAISYGRQTTDISQGRCPDGEASIYFMNPTPDGANSCAASSCVGIVCPTNRVVDCASSTGPIGALVNFSVTATNRCFPTNEVDVLCRPPSGSLFVVGTTTVFCEASSQVSARLETNYCSFTVTVLDNCPPVITQQPQSQTVIEGNPLTLSVTAAGSPPLSYRWQRNAVTIAGATNSILTIPQTTTNDAGNYTVVVANPALANGVLSSNAVVTIGDTCPIIVCPANITTNCQGPVGAVVTYEVFGGNPCNPTDFDLVCTPASGSVFPPGSTTVSCLGRAPRAGRQAPCDFIVTVLSNCPPPVCVPPPSGLVAWWPGEGNGRDIVGGHDGALQGGISFAPGQVGQAFALDGTNDAVVVPAAAELAVLSFTIAAWVYPTSDVQAAPIVEYADSMEWMGVLLWAQSRGGVGGDYPGSLYANIRGTGGAGDDHDLYADGAVPINRWSLVALTYDRPTRTARLFSNGEVVATADFTGDPDFTPQTGQNFNIGLHPEGSLDGLQGRRFEGRIDEVTLFNRALPLADMRSMFDAASAGLCPPPGNCVEISCPTHIVKACQSSDGTSVFYAAVATNRCTGGLVPVVCVPPPGTRFLPGQHTVTCEAVSSGLTNRCQFTVEILTNCPTLASLSGHVVDSSGRPVPDVTVSLAGPTNQVAMTDASGNFAFLFLDPGTSYRVTPAKANFVFSPVSQVISNLTGAVTVPFTAQSPFERWQLDHWPANTPPAVMTPDADPDGDRKANLIEYSINTDPLASDSEPVLVISLVSENGVSVPEIQVRLAPGLTDLAVTLEGADILGGDWLPLGRYFPGGPSGISDPAWVPLWPAANGLQAADVPGGWRPCPPGICLSLAPFRDTFRFFRVSFCRLIDCPFSRCGGPAPDLPPTGDSLRLGFLNAQFLPEVWFATDSWDTCCGDFPNRAHVLADRIIAGEYDVIALCEMFNDGEETVDECIAHKLTAALRRDPRFDPSLLSPEAMRDLRRECIRQVEEHTAQGKRELIEALRARYPYYVERLSTSVDDLGDIFSGDSGLMLFSKFPFEPLPSSPGVDPYRIRSPFPPPALPIGLEIPTGVAYAAGCRWSDVAFAHYTGVERCEGTDCLAEKGAGMVRIRNPHNGRVYCVVFTHTDAGDDRGDQQARELQFEIIRQMLRDVLGDAGLATEPVFLVGDLNVNGHLESTDPDPVLTSEYQHLFSCADPLSDCFGRFNAGPVSFRDIWRQQCDLDALKPPMAREDYRDQGDTATAHLVLTRRYDYVFFNDPVLPDNQHLCIQHLALAHNLKAFPTTVPAAFGLVGRQTLSDHLGLVADINLMPAGGGQCDPSRALVSEPLEPKESDDPDAAVTFNGVLTYPGSVQWYRFDQPGTYSFAADPLSARSAPGSGSQRLEVQVYDSRDLSVPLAPRPGEGRILRYPIGKGVIQARTFLSKGAPLFVRVANTNRTATGTYLLVARRHGCFSQEDACELEPGVPEETTHLDRTTAADFTRWFKLQLVRPNSGRPQGLRFRAREGGRPLARATLIEIEDVRTSSDTLGLLTGSGVRESDVNIPAGIRIPEAGVALYARVATQESSLTPPYQVRWESDVTTIFGANEPEVYLVPVNASDNDWLWWNNEYDDEPQLKFQIKDGTGAVVWELGPIPLPSNVDEEEVLTFTREGFPFIHILNDEYLLLEATEDDDGLRGGNDTLRAVIWPRLPAGGRIDGQAHLIDIDCSSEGDCDTDYVLFY